MAQYRRLSSRYGLAMSFFLSVTGSLAKTVNMFFLTAPFYFAWNIRASIAARNLSAADFALTAVALAVLLLKQFCHREEKMAAAANPVVGFATTGMFARMRRPVEVLELLFWCTVYGFGAACAGSFKVWPLAGPVLHAVAMLLWVLLDERALARQSAAYRAHKSKVWLFLPLSSTAPVAAKKEAVVKKDN